MYDKKLLRKLKKNYFTAKAMEEIIKEQAEQIAQTILDENEFYACKDWRDHGRITRPMHDYLMSDEDFERYTKMRYAEYIKVGIADARGWEWCPEAEAMELKKEAEQMLVNFALDIMPDSLSAQRDILRKHSTDYKIREQILDNILRLEA